MRLKTVLKSLLFFLLFCISFIFKPSSVVADTIVWEENFTDLPGDDWTTYQNGGQINAVSDWVQMTSSGSSFPYLHTNTDSLQELDNFVIEIKFRYLTIGPWGTGILLGTKVSPNNASLDYLIQNDARIAQFKIWQDWFGFGVYYHSNESENIAQARVLTSGIADTQEHILRIIRQQSRYKVYDNETLLFTSEETSRVPSALMLGNPRFMSGAVNSWNNLEVDYIKIFSEGKSLVPVVLVPGLGASWNTEAILLGQKAPQSEWIMTPFVRVYDNLISTFEGSGYEEGRNLFVFNYDWRQPVGDIADELDEFIGSNVGNESVNLVGHSLGGLVSREYWQTHGNGKVGKVVTLGSPHRGAVLAYEALAGGKISDNWDWASAAINILLRLRTPWYKTIADAVREEAPVLYDLVPTFEFIKKGRRTVSLGRLAFQNTWLSEANNLVSELDKINFIAGDVGQEVTEWLTLRSTGAVDKLLGLWPDGTPYRLTKGSGDGTVLLKSSYLQGENYEVFNIGHRDLPSNELVIRKTLELLEIDGNVVTDIIPYPQDDSLIFLIASPADLSVILPDGKIALADSRGFIIIPNPGRGEYQVLLIGTDLGKYHLLVGQLFGEQIWNSYEGEVDFGNNISYKFNINPDDPNKNPLSADEADRLRVILREIKSLEIDYPDLSLGEAKNKIDKAILAIDNSDWSRSAELIKESINYLFNFRRNHLQLLSLNKSERPILLLRDVLVSLLEKKGEISAGQARQELRSVRRKMSLAWRLIRLEKRKRSLNELSLVSYKPGEDLVNEARQFYRQKKYPAVVAHSFVAHQFIKNVPF